MRENVKIGHADVTTMCVSAVFININHVGECLSGKEAISGYAGNEIKLHFSSYPFV
jgi:hypothetical protein